MASVEAHELQAVMLKYFDRYSAREIAAITGHSVGTINVWLSRARVRLRTWLKEFEP